MNRARRLRPSRTRKASDFWKKTAKMDAVNGPCSNLTHVGWVESSRPTDFPRLVGLEDSTHPTPTSLMPPNLKIELATGLVVIRPVARTKMPPTSMAATLRVAPHTRKRGQVQRQAAIP